MAWLNLVVGTLEVVLAFVVLRHLGRYGRAFPWLVALIAFFLVRAADRFYVAFAGEEPFAFGALVDGTAVVLLVLLVIGIRKMVGGLEAVQDEAASREAEYERALLDYRRLMRHRIANPLAAIRGSVESMRELPDLTSEDRARLLDSADEAAARLEHIALNPRPLGSEERRLDGRPRLGEGCELDGRVSDPP